LIQTNKEVHLKLVVGALDNEARKVLGIQGNLHNIYKLKIAE